MNRDVHNIFENYQQINEYTKIEDIYDAGVGSIVQIDIDGNKYEFKLTKNKTDSSNNIKLIGTSERDYGTLYKDEGVTVQKGDIITIIDTEDPTSSVYHITRKQQGMNDEDAINITNQWEHWFDVTAKVEADAEIAPKSGKSGEAPGKDVDDERIPRPWNDPVAWAARKAASLAGNVLASGDYGKGFGSGRDQMTGLGKKLQNYGDSTQPVTTKGAVGTRPEDDKIY